MTVRLSRAPCLLVAAATSTMACGTTSETEAQSRPAVPTPARLEARAEESLLAAGHTGLGGFAFAGDGSTLFVATATYHGGPTRSVSCSLDLRAPNARPVRLHACESLTAQRRCRRRRAFCRGEAMRTRA